MIPTMHEPKWTLHGKREAYRGRVVLSEHEVGLPNGDRIRYEVDESVPFTVAVLGITEAGDLRLAREYRYPVGRWIFDLPGGGAEAGESPIEAAGREYEEETGFIPLDLEHLYTFSQNPARLAYPIHLFVAHRFAVGERVADDPPEDVRVVEMPVAEFDTLVGRGEIIDPPLLISRMIAAEKGLLPRVG